MNNNIDERCYGYSRAQAQLNILRADKREALEALKRAESIITDALDDNMNSPEWLRATIKKLETIE